MDQRLRFVTDALRPTTACGRSTSTPCSSRPWMSATLSSAGNPKSVTHVLGHFCYLSLRLLGFAIPTYVALVRTRSAAAGSASNARTSAGRARRTASTSSVVQFPRRTQITFGGAPRTKPRWRRSSSLVTIANPPSAAWRQTASSSAACRLTCRTCSDPGYSSARRPDEAG